MFNNFKQSPSIDLDYRPHSDSFSVTTLLFSKTDHMIDSSEGSMPAPVTTLEIESRFTTSYVMKPPRFIGDHLLTARS